MAHKLEKNIEATYKQSLSRRYNRVQLIGLPSLKDNRDLWLEEIYVPLGFTRKPGSGEERFYLPKALSESRHLVILGDPGSGKSTLVKLIIHAFGRSISSSLPQHFGPLLPIPIILRDYRIGEWKNYKDMLRSFIKQLDEDIRHSVSVEWLIEYLAEGRALVLLDGIDEIGNAEARRHLRDKIVYPLMEQFLENYFILTSRIVGYEEVPFDSAPISNTSMLKIHLSAQRYRQISQASQLWLWNKPISQLYVAPFNDTDIEQFITRWYTARETDSLQRRKSIESLKRALTKNDRVRGLASNPSLLTLIALIHRVTADLPSGRVKLYDKITEAYLETIEKFRRVGEHPASLEQKRRWMARVGWEMQLRRDEKQTGDLLVSREQVKAWLSEAIAEERENAEAEAETFLDYIARRSGLLIPRGVEDSGSDQFSFVHLTFQEYFAALHLRGMAWKFSEIINHCYTHLNHRYWHETILVLFEMLAEMRGSGDQLVKALIEKANSPDEQQAAAELFSEMLLDSESGLSPAVQKLATEFARDIVCIKIDDAVIERLKRLSPERHQEWIEKSLIERLKTAKPDSLKPDFFLAGDDFIVEWPNLIELELVGKRGEENWSANQLVPIILCSSFNKPKVIEWAGQKFPLLAQLALMIAASASNSFRAVMMIGASDSYSTENFDKYLNRPSDQSLDKTLNRSLAQSLVKHMERLVRQHLPLSAFFPLLDIAPKNDFTLLKAVKAEWPPIEVELEKKRSKTIKKVQSDLNSEDSWSQLLAINNLITLSAGTPELVRKRNRLCDLAMETPDKFTFPDELVEATKDKEWFNLPEIIRIIFLHEPGDPFLKPEWFDPKSEESKFFLSPPREFFALAAEVLDPKGETELAKWRKS